MQYRPLGATGIRIPVVSFGAWAIGGWMWGGTDDAAAINAIHRAIDLGMNCIDTAPTYGMGHSERIVGRAIRGRRDQVIIATKCGVRWDLAVGNKKFETRDNDGNPVTLYENLRPESVREECEASLKRIGIEVIDLYQCHWPDPTSSLDDTMDMLLRLQEEGKIRAIGVSNFSVAMMEQCLRKGALASSQPKYNALQRDIEQNVLPFCATHNISILAYSPIAQGLLTGKLTPDRTFNEGDLRRDRPMFSVENRRRVLDMLETLRPIADAHGATFAQLFLAWLLAQPGVTSTLAGARTPEQVEENARAGDLVLDVGEIARIREAVESVHLST